MESKDEFFVVNFFFFWKSIVFKYMFLLNFLEGPLTHEFKVFFYANDGTTKSS